MMRKSVWLILASFLLFWLLFNFSVMVKHGEFSQFDFNTTVRIQNHLPKSWDTLFSILSLVGSFEVTTLILLIILVGRRQLWRGLWAFFLYFLGLTVEVFGKTLVYHPGPPFLFFRYNLQFLFPTSYVQTDYSYPSGHALRASFIVVILLVMVIISKKMSFFTKCLLGTGLVGFLLLMLISRVSLGEHWTTDVIGGILLGTGLGLLVFVRGH